MLCFLKTCTVSVTEIFPQFILSKLFGSFDKILPRVVTDVYAIFCTSTSSFLKDISFFFSSIFQIFPLLLFSCAEFQYLTVFS